MLFPSVINIIKTHASKNFHVKQLIIIFLGLLKRLGCFILTGLFICVQKPPSLWFKFDWLSSFLLLWNMSLALFFWLNLNRFFFQYLQTLSTFYVTVKTRQVHNVFQDLRSKFLVFFPRDFESYQKSDVTIKAVDVKILYKQFYSISDQFINR